MNPIQIFARIAPTPEYGSYDIWHDPSKIVTSIEAYRDERGNVQLKIHANDRSRVDPDWIAQGALINFSPK